MIISIVNRDTGAYTDYPPDALRRIALGAVRKLGRMESFHVVFNESTGRAVLVVQYKERAPSQWSACVSIAL